MTDPTFLSPSPRRLFLVAALGLLAAPLAWPAGPPRETPTRLTSRPATTAPSPRLEVGDTVSTRAGERRALTLPGGSRVYLNERSKLAIPEAGKAALETGEVLVLSSREEPLVLRTPWRTLRARGANFAVRTGPKGTAVLVASGKVKIDDLKSAISAGQQLSEEGDEPAPAPRASHALGWARELLSGPRLVPASEHAGGTLVARDPEGQEAKLELRRYHVDVHVEGGFARTTVDQTFFNHTHERLEGTFRFPLPPDASLSRLAMYVNGNLMEGGMAERDHARNVYERVLYQQRDPALLEWVDGSTFRMRVFPLEPRQEKRILLSYTQRLPSLYGMSSYRFPAGKQGKVAQWSCSARISGGAELAWDSPSHAFAARREKGDLVLRASEKGANLDRDVVFRLGQSNGARADAEEAGFLTHEQDGWKYLLVRYRPGLSAPRQRERRDWVFLVETSADRDPLLARTQVELVRALLDNADPEDTFTLLSASTRVRRLSDAPLPATGENRERALRFLEEAHLIGALDLAGALKSAGAVLEAVKAPWLIHVGSGTPALGERRQEELAKALPEGTRYVGVGVGRRWNRPLMTYRSLKIKGLSSNADGW